MGDIADRFLSIYRDYVTPSLPASGGYEPPKADIRALGAVIDATIAALATGVLRYATKAALIADTSKPNGSIAYVYADPTPANNTYYQFSTTGNVWSIAQWFLDAIGLAATNALGFDYAGFSQSGYRYVVFGSDGNLLFGVTDDTIPLIVSGGFISTALNSIDQQKLGGTIFTYFGEAGFTQSGESLVLMGSDSNRLAGITDDAFPVGTGAWSVFRNARPEYVAGAAFDLFTRQDVNGDMQVYSVEHTTSAVRQLSQTGLGNINVGFDAVGVRATWATSGTDRWPSNKLRARRLDGSQPVSHLYAQKRLLTIGDSVDANSVATAGNSYNDLLATNLSLARTNRAIGGQQLWQQAMQLGAIPTFLTIPATTIATGGTAVSSIGTTNPRTGAAVTKAVAAASMYPSTMLLSTGSDNTTRTLLGWVVDSTGARQRASLVRNATGGPPSTSEVYTVNSLVGVAITTATSVVQFIPDNGDQLSYVASIGGGLNDLGQGSFIVSPPTPATILADIGAVQDAIINALGPACYAFIIHGMYNQASAFTQAGTDVNTQINLFIAERKAKYPGRYVDRKAIFLAGGDGSPTDLADIANEWIPTSLRGDLVHPNNAGHLLVYNGNSGGVGALALLSPQLAPIPTA